MPHDPDLEAFRRESDAIREVVDAKMGTVWTAIDGIRAVLERITKSVEKQAEQNTQLAIIGNTVAHFQASYVEFRTHANDQIEDHEARINALENKGKAKEWTRKGLWAAIAAGVTAAGLFISQNFQSLVALFGG